MQFTGATLLLDGRPLALQPGHANSFDSIYVDFQQEAKNGGQRWSVFLHPKQDVTIQGLEIQFFMPMPAGTRFFANGYQSQSESRLLDLNKGVPRLRTLARARYALCGDEHIAGIPRGEGKLHSWTYTWFKKPASTLLAGSLNERTGFTLFLYDCATQILTVKKDLEHLQLAHSFPALDFWISESSEQDVFEGWLSLLQPERIAPQPTLGWTSRYARDPSGAGLLKTLKNIGDSGLPFRHFLIDEGWETAAGDWFSVRPTIPSGMGNLAREIEAKGLEPGLGLAPFVVARQSELVHKNPHWLLADRRGKPLKIGRDSRWGGWYYALDFYRNDVRDYLSGVFHTVLDKWGYNILKINGLFVASLHPPAGKTRGGAMSEAMEFLRTQAGDRKIIACDVPLGAAFGTADYCCLGADIRQQWNPRLPALMHFRERPGALAALRSTLGRWRLSGRAFLSAPDAFTLRQPYLNPTQQNTFLTLSALPDALLLTSDDPGNYTPEQRAELEAAIEWQGSRILDVMEIQPDVYVINLDYQGQKFTVCANLCGQKIETKMLELMPFESLILKGRFGAEKIPNRL